jgi:hypothetical protein
MMVDAVEREDRKRKLERDHAEKEVAEIQQQQANMVGQDEIQHSGRKGGQSSERPGKSHRKFEEFWEDQVRQE